MSKASLYIDTKLIIYLILFSIPCIEMRARNNTNDSIMYFIQRPGDLLTKITNRANRIEAQLIKNTDQYLLKLQKREKKIYKRLFRSDSVAAKEAFGNIDSAYQNLLIRAKQQAKLNRRFKSNYVGGIDSLQTMLVFFDTEKLNAYGGQLKDVQNNVAVLSDKFLEADNLGKLLRERSAVIRSKLTNYGFARQVSQLQKQAYYYQQQIQDYTTLLSDPSKLEQKAVELLHKSPEFHRFFNQHSQLASLFRVPGSGNIGQSGNDMLALVRMQSRSIVEQEIMQRFGSGGNLEEQVQANVQEATNLLQQARQQIEERFGSGGNGPIKEMPNFKPNNQKTKPFLKRLEYGVNMQSVRSNQYFPTTSDIGFSVGYKFSDKSIFGIGGSYKVGWGRDIRNIAISNEGIGLRSFLDVKLKGSFWVSGGGELNYRSQFANWAILENWRQWQQSALLGIQKRYSKGKLKGTLQLSYDFLWNQQVPRTTPVVFRIGYSLSK